MSTATSEIAAPPPGQHIVLNGITWDGYLAISDALPDGSPVRATFDGERLQLMTISPEHERYSAILRRLIETVSLEFDIDLISGGSTTFRSEFVRRGLEPDECFWSTHAQQMVGVKRWQAGVHPPPDLALEIDLTALSIPRQPIYAKLEVPELWGYDGAELSILLLSKRGRYRRARKSRFYPFLAVAELQPFVELTDEKLDSAIIREFVTWLRKLNLSK